MNNTELQQIRDTLAASFPFVPTAQNDAYQQGIKVREALDILDAELARDEKPVGWMVKDGEKAMPLIEAALAALAAAQEQP